MAKKKMKFSRKEQYALIEQGKKGCSKCGDILPLDCFIKTNKGGYRGQCRHCRHVDQLERKGSTPRTKADFWHRHGLRGDYFIDKSGKPRNRERDRINNLRYMFKISFEEAYNLYKHSTEGDCDICGLSALEVGKNLHVDHCHTNGNIRGVLCYNCNHALGNVKDDIKILKNAIKYLKKDKSEAH